MRGVLGLGVLLLAACGRLGFEPASANNDASDGVSDGPVVTFVDDFERADSLTIGNGWVEKTTGTYGITGGRAYRISFAKDYRDDIVTRPPAEDLRDVEVSIEFTVTHLPPGYPQVEARVQRNTLGIANTLDGYLLYIEGVTGNGLGTAALTRTAGTSLPTPITTFPLSPELALGMTYRLRLAVRGSSPVMLDAVVERKLGTTYTTIGSVSTTDTGANPITSAGAIGFATGQPEAAGYYTYEIFSYHSL